MSAQLYPHCEAECAALLQQASSEGIHQFAPGSAVVFNKKLLLIQRSKVDEYYPGYFEFPGGRMEEGETLIEGLTRELFEETGIVPRKILRHIDTFDFFGGLGITVRQHNFLIEPVSDEVTLNPGEHDSFIWVDDIAALEKIQITPDMKRCVINAMESIHIL